MNPVPSAKQTVMSGLCTHLSVIVPCCWLVPRETRIEMNVKKPPAVSSRKLLFMYFSSTHTSRHCGEHPCCKSKDSYLTAHVVNMFVSMFICVHARQITVMCQMRKRNHLFSCAVQSFTYGNKLD